MQMDASGSRTRSKKCFGVSPVAVQSPFGQLEGLRKLGCCQCAVGGVEGFFGGRPSGLPDPFFGLMLDREFSLNPVRLNLTKFYAVSMICARLRRRPRLAQKPGGSPESDTTAPGPGHRLAC